jgi:hypothetical protein
MILHHSNLGKALHCMIEIAKSRQAAALDEVPLLLAVARGEGREPFNVQADCWILFFLVDPEPVLVHSLQSCRLQNDGLHLPERMCLQMLHHFLNILLSGRSSSEKRHTTANRTACIIIHQYPSCLFLVLDLEGYDPQ